MNILEQLFVLKQIYSQKTCYDPKLDRHIHPIPASIDSKTLTFLKQEGREVNKFKVFDHDRTVLNLQVLSSLWSITEAANVYAASLWSAPWIWRSALTAKAIGSTIPKHTFTPYSEGNETCRICGFRQKHEIDTTLTWYDSMVEGIPIDGDVEGHTILLNELQSMRSDSGTPMPTEYDIWILSSIFTILKKLPPKTRYAKAALAIKQEALLPTNNISAYYSLLESLAIIGILAAPDHPGMFTRFTTYKERDMRPNIRTEVQAPLAWWNSSYGICQEVFEKLFGHFNIKQVDLDGIKPEPTPSKEDTLVGALSRRRLPRPQVPKAPLKAGSGPARVGDIYALRIREGLWVTFYCHEVKDIGGKIRVRIEYLKGCYPQMPIENELDYSYEGRKDGRWQQWTVAIDSTPWVRRIMRGVSAPDTAEQEPDRVPYGNAKDLIHLARWCFSEI